MHLFAVIVSFFALVFSLGALAGALLRRGERREEQRDGTLDFRITTPPRDP